MRILLSAYACEPNRGSEPGVGWHWAVQLARLGHNVHVITRRNNRPVIEAEAIVLESCPSLEFYYCDLPFWLRFWKNLPGGVYPYYLLWQIAALLRAKRLLRIRHFDLVHHITFVSIHQPSFMGHLGIPFIFGPVAGGDRAPWPLRRSFPIRGKIHDMLRDLKNTLLRFDPLLRQTFKDATYIVVTSDQTKRLIPRKYLQKSRVHLAVGAEPVAESSQKTEPGHSGLNVMFSGRLLYLKGVHLALYAFANFCREYPNSVFTIVGNGPEEAWLRRISSRLSLDNVVRWIDWVPRVQMAELYRTADVLLFPSLRDSGGVVVLEALAHGMPVVCLDLGGPGVIVDSSCGFSVRTNGRRETEVIDDLASALMRLAGEPALFTKLSNGCIVRSRELAWSEQVQKLYADLGYAATNSGDRTRLGA